MKARYNKRRPKINSGDVIAFLKRPRNFANTMISLMQWRANTGDGDGLHAVIHVGVVIRADPGNKRLLAEFTSRGEHGLKVNRLRARIGHYPASILHIPLKADYQKLINKDKIQGWIRKHEGDLYNAPGLIFPESRLFTGWRRPGAMFCSEAVIHFWREIGVLKSVKQVVRRGHLVEDDIRPHKYGPADVCRMCCLDFDQAVELTT